MNMIQVLKVFDVHWPKANFLGPETSHHKYETIFNLCFGAKRTSNFKHRILFTPSWCYQQPNKVVIYIVRIVNNELELISIQAIRVGVFTTGRNPMGRTGVLEIETQQPSINLIQVYFNPASKTKTWVTHVVWWPFRKPHPVRTCSERSSDTSLRPPAWCSAETYT